MNLEPLQNTFTSGEVSPLVYERTDQDGIRSSLSKMRNCVSVPQGPGQNRDPFVFLNEIPGETNGRIGVIQSSANSFVIAIFANQEVLLFTDEGSPAGQGGFVQNPNFNLLGFGWIEDSTGIGSSVDFTRGICTLSPARLNGSEAAAAQQITITNASNLHTIYVDSDVSTLPDDLYIRVGTTQGAADILDIQTSENSFQLDFTPGQLTFWVEVRNFGDNTVIGSNSINVSRVQISDAQAVVSIPTPYDGTDIYGLQFVSAPAENVIFILHQSYPPAQFVIDSNSNTIEYSLVSFTNQPTEWEAGNYPATGVVHDNKMWYSNTPNQPGQFWASVTNDFDNLTIGVTETDAFSVVNAYFGEVQWMLSTKELVFGTANGEFLITSQGPTIYILSLIHI